MGQRGTRSRSAGVCGEVRPLRPLARVCKFQRSSKRRGGGGWTRPRKRLKMQNTGEVDSVGWNFGAHSFNWLYPQPAGYCPGFFLQLVCLIPSSSRSFQAITLWVPVGFLKEKKMQLTLLSNLKYLDVIFRLHSTLLIIILSNYKKHLYYAGAHGLCLFLKITEKEFPLFTFNIAASCE